MAHKQSYAQTKMRRIVKAMDFDTTEEFYDYIVNSKVNGNTDQCCRLFKSMPKENRKDFLSSLVDQTKDVDYYNDREEKRIYHEILKLLIEEI